MACGLALPGSMLMDAISPGYLGSGGERGGEGGGKKEKHLQPEQRVMYLKKRQCRGNSSFDVSRIVEDSYWLLTVVLVMGVGWW